MSTVDVVIPTYNRNDSLNQCLEALARQSSRDFGVIIVDDGSPSPVEETIPPHLAAALEPRVIRTEGNRGPAHARNLGVASSEATYVCFLDDDVRADPHLVATHLDAMSRVAGPVATFGPLAAPPDWKPTAWNRWEASKVAVEYTRMTAAVYEPTWRQFFTGNAMVERQLLLAAGGFDERFTRAEDVELALRMSHQGCRFEFVPEAIGWHYAARSLQSWLAIPRAYAQFDVAIAQLNPDMAWLEFIDRERTSRKFARGYRWLARSSVTRQLVVGMAIAATRATHRAGWRSPGMLLLSLAYDLEYSAASVTARRTPGAVLQEATPAHQRPASSPSAKRMQP